MKKLTFIIVTLLAFSIIGCDFLKDDEKKKTAAVTTELEGTWKDTTTCGNDLAGNESYKYSYTFTGTTAIKNEDTYSGTGCAGSIQGIFKNYYSFTIGSAITSPVAKKIDITNTRITFTPTTAQEVTNLGTMCGVTWVLNVETDLVGKTCPDGLVTLDSIKYNIFHSSGTTAGSSLKFGDGGTAAMTSDTTRPTALESSTYIKQ